VETPETNVRTTMSEKTPFIVVFGFTLLYYKTGIPEKQGARLSMDIDNSITSAFQHYQKGDFQKAKIVCAEILKEQPDNEAILYLLGIVLTQIEEYDSAIMQLEGLLRLHANNADGYLALGAIFQKKGLPDEAIRYYRKALEIDPDFAEAYENLGDIYRDKQQLDEAVIYYKKAIHYFPDAAEIYCNLGNIFKVKRQPDLAAYYYRKALLYNADYAEAHNSLGSIFFMQGRLDEAISHYQKALRINPDLSGVRMNLEDALHEKMQFDKAVKNYRDRLGFAVKMRSMKVALLINSVINRFYFQTLNIQFHPDLNYDEDYNAAGLQGQILRKILHDTDKIANIDRFFSDLDRLCAIRDYFANHGENKPLQKEERTVSVDGKPDEVVAFERLHKEFISTASDIEARLVRVLSP
jgi:tetratricopeptide (TPR) repeat protein